jgi:hypothetical protein
MDKRGVTRKARALRDDALFENAGRLECHGHCGKPLSMPGKQFQTASSAENRSRDVRGNFLNSAPSPQLWPLGRFQPTSAIAEREGHSSERTFGGQLVAP